MLKNLIHYVKNNDYLIGIYKNSIYILNYDKIIDINENIIKINLKDRKIKITGNNLYIKKLENNELSIEGIIEGINFYE